MTVFKVRNELASMSENNIEAANPLVSSIDLHSLLFAWSCAAEQTTLMISSPPRSSRCKRASLDVQRYVKGVRGMSFWPCANLRGVIISHTKM